MESEMLYPVHKGSPASRSLTYISQLVIPHAPYLFKVHLNILRLFYLRLCFRDVCRLQACKTKCYTRLSFPHVLHVGLSHPRRPSWIILMYIEGCKL